MYNNDAFTRAAFETYRAKIEVSPKLSFVSASTATGEGSHLPFSPRMRLELGVDSLGRLPFKKGRPIALILERCRPQVKRTSAPKPSLDSQDERRPCRCTRVREPSYQS